jgi:hypothetical protein
MVLNVRWFYFFLGTALLSLVSVSCGQKSGSRNCGAEQCDDLASNASEYKTARDEALANRDFEQAVIQTLNYSRSVEILNSLRNGGEPVLSIEARYSRYHSYVVPADEAVDDDAVDSLQCLAGNQECRGLLTEAKELKAIRADELSKEGEQFVATINLELVYRINLVRAMYRNDSVTIKQINADYESIWSILLQANLAKQPNGAVPGMLCVIADEQLCRSLEENIIKLRSERDRLANNIDPNAISRMRIINLEINYNQEKLDAFRYGSLNNRKKILANIESKYNALRELSQSDKNFRPYSDRELLAVDQVFREFGALYISASPKDVNGKYVASEVKANEPTPWSAYWYPKRKRELFDGPSSPLGKLDTLAQRTSGHDAISSVAWEEARFSPDDAEWAGLCDAWAVASIQTPEPKHGLRYQGIDFSVVDLKALIIKKYEGYRPTIYGNRYYGSHDTDGEIQDLRPEAFHRIVEKVIGEQKRAFVVDEDPGPEVWSRPFFRMRWVIEPDQEQPNAYLVRAWPFLLKNRTSVEDSQLTNPTDLKAPVYEYRLYTDPRQKKNGKEKVIYGEWINDSLTEHPDMVILPNSDGKLTPPNPEFAKGMDLIDSIFSQGTPIP